MHSRHSASGHSSSNRRPSRIPQWVLVVGMTMLATSFVSGVVIWWGQTVNARFDSFENPHYFQLKVWLKLHGALNPFLCGLLGYLTHQHMRVGWHLKANRWSGAILFIIFAGLVVSGTALYYSGGENFRTVLVWIHRICGVALPLTLATHWLAALRWIKQV